MHIKIPVSVN